jgi:hypothetical protein
MPWRFGESPGQRIEHDYEDTITRHEYEHAYEYDARRYDYDASRRV